jgi:hypothetical protein
MWKRVAWDLLALILVIIAPWWVVLVVGIMGAIVFPWYVELVFLGALIDALYGGNASRLLGHFIHAGIFSVPLLCIEFIRTRINI